MKACLMRDTENKDGRETHSDRRRFHFSGTEVALAQFWVIWLTCGPAVASRVWFWHFLGGYWGSVLAGSFRCLQP